MSFNHSIYPLFSRGKTSKPQSIPIKSYDQTTARQKLEALNGTGWTKNEATSRMIDRFLARRIKQKGGITPEELTAISFALQEGKLAKLQDPSSMNARQGGTSALITAQPKRDKLTSLVSQGLLPSYEVLTKSTSKKPFGNAKHVLSPANPSRGLPGVMTAEEVSRLYRKEPVVRQDPWKSLMFTPEAYEKALSSRSKLVPTRNGGAISILHANRLYNNQFEVPEDRVVYAKIGVRQQDAEEALRMGWSVVPNHWGNLLPIRDVVSTYHRLKGQRMNVGGGANYAEEEQVRRISNSVQSKANFERQPLKFKTMSELLNRMAGAPAEILMDAYTRVTDVKPQDAPYARAFFNVVGGIVGSPFAAVGQASATIEDPFGTPTRIWKENRDTLNSLNVFDGRISEPERFERALRLLTTILPVRSVSRAAHSNSTGARHAHNITPQLAKGLKIRLEHASRIVETVKSGLSKIGVRGPDQFLRLVRTGLSTPDDPPPPQIRPHHPVQGPSAKPRALTNFDGDKKLPSAKLSLLIPGKPLVQPHLAAPLGASRASVYVTVIDDPMVLASLPPGSVVNVSMIGGFRPENGKFIVELDPAFVNGYVESGIYGKQLLITKLQPEAIRSIEPGRSNKSGSRQRILFQPYDERAPHGDWTWINELVKLLPSEPHLAPRGYDDWALEIHHWPNQRHYDYGLIISQTGHRRNGNFKLLHPNTGQLPSDVFRPTYSKWGRELWGIHSRDHGR